MAVHLARWLGTMYGIVKRLMRLAISLRRPEAFPALMAGFDGMLAGMSAMLLGAALLVRWFDPRVRINPLWAKNLTYFFAHTYANLIIYMLAALIYVGLPYATGRKYHTSMVLVVGWWCSLVLTLTNYVTVHGQKWRNYEKNATFYLSFPVYRDFYVL